MVGGISTYAELRIWMEGKERVMDYSVRLEVQNNVTILLQLIFSWMTTRVGGGCGSVPGVTRIEMMGSV